MDKRNYTATEPIRRRRRRRRRRRINPLFLILTVAVMLFALWKFSVELTDKIQSKKYHDDLAQDVVRENTQPAVEETVLSVPSEETHAIEVAPIQVDFQELRVYYPDIVGWLYCPNTTINYPLVQTDNNQYYIHRLPNGKESAGGSLFLDCTNAWDFSDPNTVVYGHDMKDGSMFGYLHNYDQQTYYVAHPTFYLLTPSGNFRMDVVYANVVPDDSDLYLMKMDEELFSRWKDSIRSSMIIPTGHPAEGAENFLTLSTCSYEFENARFVVIGALRKIH